MVCAALIALGLAATSTEAEDGAKGPSFRGRLLVVASDGDMQASAYVGAPLGPRAEDLLSVIRLDQPLAGALVASVAVPNSVIGPPAAMALTPDGHYAIVAETRGPQPPNATDAHLKELPPGRTITVIDIANPAAPQVVQQLQGPDNPIAVTVRPDGQRVAIAYDTAGADRPPLVIYTFADGRLIKPLMPAIPGSLTGDRIRNAVFDGPMQALAIIYSTHPRISFLQWQENASEVTLRPWGNDVPLGRAPFEVRFSPDGRFGLINDMDVPGSGPDVRGTITSIAVAQSTAADGTPQHVVVSTARTGVLPEGLTVSPDGRWVASSNLERTAYPIDDPRQGGFSSITLIRLNPQSGVLQRVGDFAFNGIIPEGLVFDDDSRSLAVIAFDHFAGRATGASIDIWRLAGDFQDSDRIELVPTGLSIPVPRGAQSLDIAR